MGHPKKIPNQVVGANWSHRCGCVQEGGGSELLMSYTNYLQLGVIKGRQSGFQGMEMTAGNFLLLLVHGDDPTGPYLRIRMGKTPAVNVAFIKIYANSINWWDNEHLPCTHIQWHP